MDPSLPSLADQTATVGLTVQTNANSGYTLAVSDNATGLQSASAGNPVIAKVSTGKARFCGLAGPDQVGLHRHRHGCHYRPGLQRVEVAGYTAAGETIATRASATGGTADTISIANRVAIDFSAATGVYTDTVTYTVTPNYN